MNDTSSDINTDVVIVGGGPGGYTAAIACARRGLTTVLVEGAHLGGTCLNMGCIPSKALIHASDRFADAASAGMAELGISSAPPTIDLARTVAWKDSVVEKLRSGVSTLVDDAKVHHIRGWGAIIDGKTVSVGDVTVHARHLVLASGSRSTELHDLPFGGSVISSTEALELSNVPDSLVVVGAGYIGLELGTAFRKLGADVTVVEMADRVLPAFDAQLTVPVAHRLAQLGIDVCTGSRVVGPGPAGRGVTIEDAGGKTSIIDGDKTLVAVGRIPATDGWNLESLDLARDGSFVQVDARCRTSMTGVYAIGDLTGEPMLAHRAMAQAEVVADVIAGGDAKFDHRAVPSVCFTDPEVFSVGLSPDEADALGFKRVVGVAQLRTNGRALTLGRPDGLVRVVADTVRGSVLGIQAVGAGVAELSSAAALAIEMDATLEDLTFTIQAHPTLGEAFHDAATTAAARIVGTRASAVPAAR